MNRYRQLFFILCTLCLLPSSRLFIPSLYAAEEAAPSTTTESPPAEPVEVKPGEEEKEYAAGEAATIEKEVVTKEEEEDKSEIKTAEEVAAEEKAEEAAATPLTLDADALKIYTADDIADLAINHKQEIVFAMSGSFFGHFAQYGSAIRNGILAHFARINGTGGIHHKQLRLLCFEDHGTPAIAQRIMNTLRRKHKVDMFIGCMGSRNLNQSMRLIKAKKIGMFFPWGSNGHLSEDDDTDSLSHLINGSGIMEPQLRALVSHCSDTLRLSKVGIFYSDGSFNTQTKRKLSKMLEETDRPPVAEASYNRFTMDINHAASKLIKKEPRVVICLGSSMPVAKLMSRFLELGSYGTTFIGSDSTMWVPDILRTKGAEFAYTSTVPDPVTTLIPLAQTFREDMTLNFPNDTTNILTFAYYINANIITTALKSVTGDFIKDDVLSAIEEMKDIDIGGFKVTFNPETRLAYPHHVSIIKGDRA